MNRLFLLRHAKARWAQPGMRDFDRPLEKSGIADAQAIGAAMHARGYVPEFTLCSKARRARETLEAAALHAETGRVKLSQALFEVDATGYLAMIRDNAAAGSILVVGHNPMMEDLAIAVSGQGDETAMATLRSGFPTSGLAVIRFEGRLSDATPGAGYLEAFLTPGDL